MKHSSSPSPWIQHLVHTLNQGLADLPDSTVDRLAQGRARALGLGAFRHRQWWLAMGAAAMLAMVLLWWSPEFGVHPADDDLDSVLLADEIPLQALLDEREVRPQ